MEQAPGRLQVKLEPGLIQFQLLEAMQCETTAILYLQRVALNYYS